MVAQDLVETGLLDSVLTAFTSAVAGLEQSVENHPWIWAAAIAVCVVLLLRPKR